MSDVACREMTPDELRQALFTAKANESKLRYAVQDFMDYFRPRGGVSDVPLGPFERAQKVIEEIKP